MKLALKLLQGDVLGRTIQARLPKGVGGSRVTGELAPKKLKTEKKVE